MRTVDYNHVPAYYLTDIAFSYAFYTDGDRNAEAYLNVDNLFDKDPPPVAISGVAYSPMTQPALYDVYGRSFRVGVRFRM
jgi:outer membrane receptor protein involved in Fe transport